MYGNSTFNMAANLYAAEREFPPKLQKKLDRW